MNVVPTVKEMLTEKNSSTAEQALIWMRHLLQIYAEKMLPTIDDILSKVLLINLHDVS
jgi:vacuole morphology and inheritance protein 14